MCTAGPQQGGGIWVLTVLGGLVLFPAQANPYLEAAGDGLDDPEIMQPRLGRVCEGPSVPALCLAEAPSPSPSCRVHRREGEAAPAPGHHFTYLEEELELVLTSFSSHVATQPHYHPGLLPAGGWGPWHPALPGALRPRPLETQLFYSRRGWSRAQLLLLWFLPKSFPARPPSLRPHCLLLV